MPFCVCGLVSPKTGIFFTISCRYCKVIIGRFYLIFLRAIRGSSNWFIYRLRLASQETEMNTVTHV